MACPLIQTVQVQENHLKPQYLLLIHASILDSHTPHRKEPPRLPPNTLLSQSKALV